VSAVLSAEEEAQGFLIAEHDGTCALRCNRWHIYPGAKIHRMPDGWKPERPRRHAHAKCFRRWLTALEEATGHKFDLRVPS